jgi:hypothetical protein
MFAQAEQETNLSPAIVGHQKSVAPAAVIRWMTKGVLLRDGTRLQLQCVRLPGSFRTSKAWLDAFLEAIANDKAGAPTDGPKRPATSARVSAMRAELAEAGFQVTT